MASKSIRNSANEQVLLRLHEDDLYARQVVPVGDRRRRAPWPPSPHIISLVLREVSADPVEKIEVSHRH